MNIVGGLILIVFAATFPQSEARDTINQGVRAFRNADYKAAVEYFKQALDLDPNMATAEIYLATAYAQQYVPGGRGADNEKNAQMAIQTFENVLRRDPNNLNALAGLASIYFNLGQSDTKQLQKSKEFYTKYAQLDSTNPIPYYTIGVLDWLIVYDKNNTSSTDEKSKVIDEGLASIDNALALNPNFDDAMTYKNLLFREKARLVFDPTEKARLITLADDWFNIALETRKKNSQRRQYGVPQTGGNVITAPPPPPSPRQ